MSHDTVTVTVTLGSRYLCRLRPVVVRALAAYQPEDKPKSPRWVLRRRASWEPHPKGCAKAQALERAVQQELPPPWAVPERTSVRAVVLRAKVAEATQAVWKALAEALYEGHQGAMHYATVEVEEPLALVRGATVTLAQEAP